MYIVFEWIVGTGKSTQSKKLVEHLKNTYPQKEVIHVREPGGTHIAEAIRTLAQGTEFAEDMDPICEAYLYAAARAQLLYTVVKPALDRGAIVVADRSVVSSLAYQGYAREVGVDKVWDINRQAIISCLPSIIFYLEGDIEHAISRTDDAKGDKFETMGTAFFEKVAEGYQKVSGIHIFKHAWQTIDAHGTVEEVFERIIEKIVVA